jgi:hypothetical protein
VAVLLVKLPTTSSLFTVSTARPSGPLNPVGAPVSVRVGSVLPFAVRAWTVMELLAKFATTSSLFTRSTTTPAG